MKFSTFTVVAALTVSSGALAHEAPSPVNAGLCQHTTTQNQVVATVFDTVTQQPTTTTTPTVYETTYRPNQIVHSTDVEIVSTITKQQQTTLTVQTTITNIISKIKTITAPVSTTTLAPSTSTVATTNGFVMAISALPASSGTAEDSKKRVHARDMSVEKRGKDSFKGFLPCTHTVTNSITATRTKTKISGRLVTETARPTTSTVNATKRTTLVVTDKSTAVITKTKTFSTTITHQTTSTSSSTTTVTPVRTAIPSPVATYAACAAPNLLDYTLGRPNNATGTPWTEIGISSFSMNHYDTVKNVPAAKSAYDCCVACQANADCAFSAFSANKVCSIFVGKTCSAQKSDTASFYGSKSVAPGSGFTISNGKCGAWSFVAATI